MSLGLVIAVGSFVAAYWVGWLFLNWAFLHKYDEADLSLQVRRVGNDAVGMMRRIMDLHS